MSHNLVLTVRLHDERYHGTPEWPPAPARVFQALVAGAARGNALPAEAARALEWLERLPPPVIAAPRARVGNSVEMFVPNNDADTVGGDPATIADIRTKKLVKPWLLDGDAVLLYAWPLVGSERLAPGILDVAAELFQLGRGIDMAWAVGEPLDDDALSARIAEHRSTLHRPSRNATGNPLACPAPGSLESLLRRHREGLQRIRVEGVGSTARTLFAQPPKPRFVPVGYENLGHRFMYELRDREDDARRSPCPLARVVMLIEQLRDGAATRLRDAFPEQRDEIERTLIGRKADGTDDGPIGHRVRIVPLPSIGHEHTDCAVRRVLVEVPSDCPLRASDVKWAFSGLDSPDAAAVDIGRFVLTPMDADDMLGRYQAEHGARRWRSITAAALPTNAQRRRIEPSRRREEAKDARERANEERSATRAVHMALRHTGVTARLVEARVQREPFAPRGARAEAFGKGTRFAKERLWHVELELSEPITGPLVLGDGRFLGLGLMTPLLETAGVFAFAIGDDATVSDGDALVRAMRRAVMSRAQAQLGARPLGRFFSGHEQNGDPARSEQSNHIAVQWDPMRRRLLVIAPHVLDHRHPNQHERGELDVLGQALEKIVDLRAGRAGRFLLSRCAAGETLAYLERSTSWSSVRPYVVTRHPKRGTATAALAEDAIAECARRRLPRPEVTVVTARGVPGRGLEGDLRLDFAVAVAGPIVLGRSRHAGGGLFLPDHWRQRP